MTIFKKIPEIMGEVGAIEKTRTNTQGSGYQFRGIDDVYFVMQPLLSKHGVFFAPNVLRESREERQSKSGGTLIYTILTVEFTFYAGDASSFKVTTVGEAMDSGDKSSNKAMSAALKYALLQLFCIPTKEDNDTENSSPDPVHNLGAYVMTMGKAFKGKRLDACDVYELSSFSEWLTNQTNLNGSGLETRNKIEEFLKSREFKRA